VRDVGVIQGGEHLRLTLEARQSIGVVGEEIGQDFQRDVAIEPHIARAIHVAHAARANQGRCLVGAESGARRKRHLL
jgi:hypothetical protein